MAHKIECQCRKCVDRLFPDAIVDTDAILRIAERKCMDATPQVRVDADFIRIVAHLGDTYTVSQGLVAAYE